MRAKRYAVAPPSGAACLQAAEGLARAAQSSGVLVARARRAEATPLHQEPEVLQPYLGNASFTPPSTGSIAPVVFAERGPARNSAASATSSAVTSTFSNVRLR